MISISNLQLNFDDRILFDNISITLKDNDKIGIIGRNGVGKTTFFKVLTKEITPDKVNLDIPSNKTIGYLKQDIEQDPDNTVIDETLTAFNEILNMKAEISEIETELTARLDYESDDYMAKVQHLSDLNDILKNHDINELKGNVEKILKGLGFQYEEFTKKTSQLSGGWQIRIEIAKLLLKQPDFILLDEPTNHLDIEAIIWLEDYLRNYSGTVMIISHDQRFLDNITNRTIEFENTRLYDYPLPYTKAMELRADRREKLISAYKNQQNVIKEKERTIERFMAKATKTKLAQSMQKQLDKIERIEIEEFDTKTMKLIFPPAERSGQIVIKAQDIYKAFGKKEVLKGIDFQLERGEKISFVGQNGQGKTTLAKIIIGEHFTDKGNTEIGHNVKIGYYAQNQSDKLENNLTVLETMENNATIETRANIRTLLGAFLFSGEDVEKKVSVLSGGERARLSIALMLLRPFNLLILDEPTNHLDILSKHVLKQALADYTGSMIVVSHDREFLSGLTEKTIEFRDHKLKTYLGDVTYFLEKRQVDDLRNVSITETKKSSTIEQKSLENKSTISLKLRYEERKNILRDLKKIENNIQKLEENISSLEKAMTDPEFHKDNTSIEKMKNHQDYKVQLDNLMEEWTLIQEKLDES